MSEREGLAARVRQMRRSGAISNPRPDAELAGGDLGTLDALQGRVAQLEEMVEGLQDSVHRESLRQGDRITELEARLEPGALAVALSDNARERGL
jgi:hypothetical protein